MLHIRFFVLLVALSVPQRVSCYAQAGIPKESRVVFLGDSITHSGGFIVALETALLTSAPERKFEILNLGLPSETVSGLSEPGHAGGKFPRPDLHERLTRVLDQIKPQLVVACYGMNDGIYYPLSESRFQKYRSGIERLHQSVVDRGARIIHLTPAYFDALPIRDRLLPLGRDEYQQPYEGYDDVLEEYSKWLLEKKKIGWEVYDVHSSMKDAVKKERRTNATFTFANDGVHPNAAGQAIIAIPLANAWGLMLDTKGLPNHPRAEAISKIIAQKQQVLKLAWLSATGHLRPGINKGLPLEEANAKAAELESQARALLSE